MVDNVGGCPKMKITWLDDSSGVRQTCHLNGSHLSHAEVCLGEITFDGKKWISKVGDEIKEQRNYAAAKAYVEMKVGGERV